MADSTLRGPCPGAQSRAHLCTCTYAGAALTATEQTSMDAKMAEVESRLVEAERWCAFCVVLLGCGTPPAMIVMEASAQTFR